LLIALSFCSLMALASASVALSGVLKDCCAIAEAETMNNTIPLRSLFFMSVPLTMTEFTVFSTSRTPDVAADGGQQLSALRTTLLLRLPVGGAAVVTAQRIRAAGWFAAVRC
jgi:hypothetical protein